ncbi:hypothetical protein BDB01DRAFT_851071 [Pilobolus umbonatus]|nr:hypothetical protein BDB01DRAFT_851071 [Pilobolus umbonatus]
MYSLSVELPEILSKEVLSEMWVEEVPTSGMELMVGRMFSQITTSPDRKKFLIQGGKNYGTPLEHPFIIYDIDTKAWTAATDYNQFGIENATIYAGASFYSNSINKYVFYGGTTEFTNNQTVEIGGYAIPSNPEAYTTSLPVGFNRVNTYDIETDEWDTLGEIEFLNDTFFLKSITSVYSEKTDTAYFFVTRYADLTNTSADFWPDYRFVYSLEVGNRIWQCLECSGTIPGRREDHTTTLLPDGKTVLFYGGTADYENALSDFCYLLDLDTHVWAECNFIIPEKAVPQRYYQSAVLVGHHVFLLFGLSNARNIDNQMAILDVSDSSQIRLVGDYMFKEADIPSNTSMITGIVLGCACAIALISGAIYFYFRRKLKKVISRPPSFDNAWLAHHESDTEAASSDPRNWAHNSGYFIESSKEKTNSDELLNVYYTQRLNSHITDISEQMESGPKHLPDEAKHIPHEAKHVPHEPKHVPHEFKHVPHEANPDDAIERFGHPPDIIIGDYEEFEDDSEEYPKQYSGGTTDVSGSSVSINIIKTSQIYSEGVSSDSDLQSSHGCSDNESSDSDLEDGGEGFKLIGEDRNS